MKKLAIFIGLAALLLCATPAFADGAVVLPHAFYGSVTINDSPAPPGTAVEARGEGVATGISCNPVTTAVSGIYGTSNPYEPRLIVQGEIQDGSDLTFYVNGVSTGQTAEWHSGDTTELNLSLVSDVTAQKVETVPAGQTGHVIDFSTQASTTVTVNTVGEVVITAKKYQSNPHPEVPPPADMLPRYIDIEIDNLDAVDWPMYVEQTYTDAEVAGLVEANLGMYYFQAGAWHRCSDTGVNTTANYIWANMTKSELSGSPIAIGSPAAAPPSAPPAGGGGGGPEISRVTLTGLTAWPSLRVDPLGTVQSTCCLTSSDGRLTLDITEGTVILDSEGNPLTYLSTSHERYPPKAPEGRVVVTAYDLALDGANFDPAITLTIKYDPKTLPEGCAEKDLCISYWDGEKCCDLKTTCNVEANTVSCQVRHFTVFAVIGTIAPPEVAAFSISKLVIEPAKVSPKEPVNIIATVANSGDKEGTYTVVLSVNEVKEAEKSVTVAAGSSQDVSFTAARAEVGSYSVTVDGLSGEFKVTTPAMPAPAPAPAPTPSPAAKPLNWPLIGGIIAGVIVVVVVIFSVARRRA
jgi:hypothetical protein